MTTVFNSGSGNWDDESTWLGGKVPGPLDDVVLNYTNPSNPNVSYQVSLLDEAVHNLTILEWNMLSVSTALSVDLLLMSQSSALIGGGYIHTSEGVQNNGTIYGSFTFSTFGDEILNFVNWGTITSANYLEIDPLSYNVSNFGFVEAWSRLALALTINTGNIYGSAPQILLAVPSGAEMISNAGTIEMHDGAMVEIGGTIENTPDGRLIVDDSLMSVTGAMIGGSVAIFDNGKLEVTGSPTQQSTTSIIFQGTGSAWLENSSNYAGTVKGFGVGNWLGAVDVSFVPDRDFYDPQSGILVVGDGEHAAEFQLSGSYAADDFVFREYEDQPGSPALSWSASTGWGARRRRRSTRRTCSSGHSTWATSAERVTPRARTIGTTS